MNNKKLNVKGIKRKCCEMSGVSNDNYATDFLIKSIADIEKNVNLSSDSLSKEENTAACELPKIATVFSISEEYLYKKCKDDTIKSNTDFKNHYSNGNSLSNSSTFPSKSKELKERLMFISSISIEQSPPKTNNLFSVKNDTFRERKQNQGDLLLSNTKKS